MKSKAVLELMGRVVATRVAVAAGSAAIDELHAGLVSIRELRAYLDSTEASIVVALKPVVSFPEAAIAEASRGSVGGASRTVERANTLDAAPGLADALGDAVITAGHVDAVTRVGQGLDPAQRRQLIERANALVDVAAAATVEQFARRLRDERRRLLADDGQARLEQQQRATSMHTWVDGEGMWNVRGRFDPVLGITVAAALDAAVEALFAEQVPPHCPLDPIAKQAFLRAHAFARIAEGRCGAGRPGRPEFVVVIDAGQRDAADDPGFGVVRGVSGRSGDRMADRVAVGPVVDWPIAVEVPARVLAAMIEGSGADPVAVVVRNGVVIHAPGELNLGRSTRLANRAQRRALRGLYATCAIPGCSAHYDRCKLHHIVWWRHGGRTDLGNLLPLCAVHHRDVHHSGWILELGDRRALVVRFPDGSVQSTGPPNRRAA